MKAIDFSGEFRRYVLENLQGEPEMDEEEADEFAHRLYHQWIETPMDWLDGKTPQAYFEQFDDPRELIAAVGEYLEKDWDIPESLMDRLSALAKKDFSTLVEAVRNPKNSDTLRAVLLGLLSEAECPEVDAICEEAILRAGQESEFSEMAVEILSYGCAEETLEKLIRRYPAANDYAKLLLLDVLCNYPGDDRVYSYCMERLFADPENRALYANYLLKLGDDRAVEPLQRLLGLTDLTYLDYLELRNAVEALGGDPGEERAFYGDPDYEAMRNL